jgi:hypothetical protein
MGKYGNCGRRWAGQPSACLILADDAASDGMCGFSGTGIGAPLSFPDGETVNRIDPADLNPVR